MNELQFPLDRCIDEARTEATKLKYAIPKKEKELEKLKEEIKEMKRLKTYWEEETEALQKAFDALA